jgi:hypothetical protein
VPWCCAVLFCYVVRCRLLLLLLLLLFNFVYVVLSATLPRVSMRQRIFEHSVVVGNFDVILAEQLTYKIVVKGSDFVAQFPGVFEQGVCEYGVAIDSLLEHVLVGNTGLSEMVTVTRNGDFLKVFDICCNFSVMRDQKDPSSVFRLRPDDTIVSHGAVMLKNEAKGDIQYAEVAKEELTKKLDKSAMSVFPANSQSIIGMTTFPNSISLYSIDYNHADMKFETSHLKSYDMRHLEQRVTFVQDIFKIAQWMSTVTGPQLPFHLIPGVRTKTPNGHHITWTDGVIHKELKARPTTRASVSDLTAVLGRIGQVYAAKLDNVEWGEVKGPNIIEVHRVGFQLSRAINNRMISKDTAITNIRKGRTIYLTFSSQPKIILWYHI